MKIIRRLGAAIVAVFILTSSCTKVNYTGSEAEKFADSLIKIMTLQEKIGQLTLFTSGWDITGPSLRESYKEDIISGRCGNIFNAHTVKYNIELQKMAVEESRLGIPLLFGYDVIHGHKTIYPIPLAESCSWDSLIIEKSASLSAKEATASGLNWTFNPMVDISRDPRWGRVAEGSGEDVLLGSIAARARVRGYQGNDLSDKETMAACVKHFAAYGAPQGGRDYNTVDMSERVFREDYLPPYEAAIDVGVASIMTSFNELFGVPASANEFLLKQILREELGFKGMVVTDYTSINEMVAHGYAENNKQAAELAFNAGVEMDMQGAVYYNYLEELLEEGKVKEEDINASVKRVLVLKYKLGLFEDPYRYLNEEREKSIVLSKELNDHALYAAERSMVLLKNTEYNSKKLLPLSDNYKRIAIIGPLANNKVDLLGSWHAAGGIKGMKSLSEALSERYPDAKISTVKGCGFEGDDRSGFAQAISQAQKSDVVILAVGENYTQSGEAASRTNIDFPGVQNELIEKIVATGKPVIAVVFTGRPLTISWMDENIHSILYAWQPGTKAAEAVVNVLSGKYNPSGKLTITFPRNVGQIPVHYDMKNTGRPLIGSQKYQSKYIDSPNSPLYPFGFGLSYTNFEYSDISISDTVMDLNGNIEVSLKVKNIGNFKGEEIAQMYIRDMVGKITRPVLELKAFEKFELNPGDEKILTFIIKEKDLRYMHSDMKYSSDKGEFEVLIGPNSSELKFKVFSLI